MKTFQTDDHQHPHAPNRFAVIPLAEKLKADSRLTGKNVRVAFLDAGFFPHPDFAGRVVAFHDVAGEEPSFHAIREAAGHHWHGTQTVAVCAGSGALSGGVYRGLAPAAELVLVKVSDGGRISDAAIEKGLEWVLENREKYRIRVLNISLGGDRDASFRESRINALAEKLVAAGVSVTVAAGNAAGAPVIPPASAPSVLTVGGFSDENQFAAENFELYHSNFGATIDGLIKPELIAPAMHVAAPILPGTKDYVQAETLSMLLSLPDYAFRIFLDEFWEQAGLPDYIGFHGVDSARARIEEILRERRWVATHYQHVDGTSFAAPVTAAVVAQMLEANPALTPPAVKNILVATAQRLARHPSIRQGYGVLNPSLAVAEARRETHFLGRENFGPPRVEGSKIVFHHHDDAARSVFLAGDFNDWKIGELAFEKHGDGVWRAAINCLKPGRYRYKFCVDGGRWTEDASHGLKEEDGFGGFHSLLVVE
ncbi:MAG: S8 family serine peptidase [Acidobacteria bacterium]|nr:S8 family serine peptidase [Acidobacteriota bacterium]